MAWQKVPQEHVDAFHAALPKEPGVELRKMFGCPAGFVNGNMFCGAHESNILVRLPEKERTAALAKGGFKPFEPMGRPMKEYVCLPPEKLTDITYLNRWFVKAMHHVASMPPKAPKPRKP